jgi:toxin YoeB
VSERNVTYDPQMLEDLEWWRDNDATTGARIVELIELAIEHPKEGRGRPKRLGGLVGAWSRRITLHHRLLYVVHEDGITFICCKDHDFPPDVWHELHDGSWSPPEAASV